MFDLDQIPERLRPTEAVSNQPNAEVDDRCTELMARFRTLSTSIDDSQFTMRYSKAITSIAPFLSQKLDLSSMRVLEIGSGHGAKSLALAPFVSEYVGLEISAQLVNFAQDAKKKFGASNVHFELDEAANIAGFLEKQTERFDLILLYAVLEHLTVDEKLTLMAECWKYLSDDGFLFIGETPNRMLPVDLHSSQLLYLQQAPLEIWRRSYQNAGNAAWREAMKWHDENDAFEFGAYRRGLHVGHQELDLGLMPVEQLQDHIVDDSFSAHIMNLYFYMPVEFLKLVEFGYLNEYIDSPHIVGRDFPPFLSRYFIEVLLAKQPQAPRFKTSIQAMASPQTRMVSGDRVQPEIIAAKRAARWTCATHDGVAPTSALIGFHHPASIGNIAISVDGDVVDEAFISAKSALLKTWRQELVYEVAVPPNSPAPTLEIRNESGNDIGIRFVGFR